MPNPVVSGNWFTKVFGIGAKLTSTQVVTGGFVLLLTVIIMRGEQDRAEWLTRFDRMIETERVHKERQSQEHWDISAILDRIAATLDRILAALFDWVLGIGPKKPQSGVKTQPTSTTAGPGTAPAPSGSNPEH